MDLVEDLDFRKSFALLAHLNESFRFNYWINIHCFVALIFHFHLLKFSVQFFTGRFTITILYFRFSILEQMITRWINFLLGPKLSFPLSV